MGKRRHSPGQPISRAGLWLIGGTLLLSLGVFAWAFQEETPRAVSGARLPAPGRTTRDVSRTERQSPSREAEETMTARPPDASQYEALLGRDLFRPLVTPESRAPRSKPPTLPRAESREPRAERVATDIWRGWRFNGVAQLDQKTFALMDQPGQKRSRFVGPGDRLEDAVVTRVQEGAVTLRPAEGGLVEISRVDAMAELLRPMRSPAVPRGEPSPTGQPSGPFPGGAPGTVPPVVTGPAGQQFAPAPPAGYPTEVGGGGAFDAEARRARRERQLRERSGDYSTNDEASSEE